MAELLEVLHANDAAKLRAEAASISATTLPALERERRELSLASQTGDDAARKRVRALHHEIAEAEYNVSEKNEAADQLDMLSAKAKRARLLIERKTTVKRLLATSASGPTEAKRFEDAAAALCEAGTALIERGDKLRGPWPGDAPFSGDALTYEGSVRENLAHCLHVAMRKYGLKQFPTPAFHIEGWPKGGLVERFKTAHAYAKNALEADPPLPPEREA